MAMRQISTLDLTMFHELKVRQTGNMWNIRGMFYRNKNSVYGVAWEEIHIEVSMQDLSEALEEIITKARVYFD